MNQKLELLSPAGDMERLKLAVKFGADAVYVGGEMFGMRTNPSNFISEQLKQAVDLVHKENKKIYLTCNTLPRNDELEFLPEYLKYVADIGVDALIIADMGVLAMAKKYAPDVEIHMSTQVGIVNYAAANALYDMGAKRIVTARELSLDEIKTIRDKTNPNLEGTAFYAQTIPRPGKYFPINQDENGTYIFNSRDLCMIDRISDLDRAGIDSFKIEGRAKSEYYTAIVTYAYRNAVDEYLAAGRPENFMPSQWILDEMEKMSHREYTHGFNFGPIKNGQVLDTGGYIRNWDVCAVFKSEANGRVTVIQRNRFYQGDELEVVEPFKKPYKVIVAELYNENDGEFTDVANKATDIYSFRCDKQISKDAIFRVIRK